MILTKDQILEFTADDTPKLVVTDNLYSGFSWLIRCHARRKHVHGFYSHSMWLYKSLWVATQGWMHKEVPIVNYLNGDYRVKFWYNPAWTNEDKNKLTREIWAGLNESWWRRRYDWLGIVGQAVNIPKLNIPWLNYCGERTVKPLRTVESFEIKHPTPSWIDWWCKEQHWMSDVYDPSMEVA